MTEVFDRFMNQSRKQGREYGDGYAPFHFAGLTAEERDQALGLLMQQAVLGDGVAIDGLALLGTKGAREELIRLLEQFPSPSAEHVAICEALFKVTGASEWQDCIVDDVGAADEFTRRRALAALERTSTPQSSRQVLDIFVDWLSTSQDEAARSTATGGLMQALGFPPLAKDQTHERLVLERNLFNATGASIEAALNQARATLLKRGG